MPTFSYEIRDERGRMESGTLTAGSAAEATEQLRSQGNTVVSLRAMGGVGVHLRRIKTDDVIFLANQLAVMVDTGVPLSEALDAIASSTNHTGMQAMVSDLSEQVKSGVEFSTALENYPKVFSNLFISLMRASEVSGTMGPMLQRASAYMGQDRETRKQIKGALVYPVCMLSFCVVVVIALLVFVLPRFESIYAGKGALLPLPTRILLGASRGLIANWLAIAIGLVATVGGLVYYVRTDTGRRVKDRALLAMPLLGTMFRKANLARSLRTMSTMVSTGVSMLDGLEITARVASNVFYKEVWLNLAERVKEGSTLSSQLFECPLIPRTTAQMIDAGERTGKLGLVMDRVAEFCEDDLKISVKAITSMIEPIMIITMGLLVGGIAMALLLPIFNMSKMMSSH
jgi:type IV pilus assembly protein PilC